MKTKIVIVTHGSYGHSLLAAAEAIVGPLDVMVIEVSPLDTGDEIKQRIDDILASDHLNSVLVLTDLCGSTPSNCCTSLLANRPESEIITGINLPMLVKLSTCQRCHSAWEIAQEIVVSAERSISIISKRQHAVSSTKGNPCGA